jgi:hypothetical protein
MDHIIPWPRSGIALWRDRRQTGAEALGLQPVIARFTTIRQQFLILEVLHAG